MRPSFTKGLQTYKRCGGCEAIYEELCDRSGDYDEWPDRELKCGHSWEERHEDEPPELLQDACFWTPEEKSAFLDEERRRRKEK